MRTIPASIEAQRPVIAETFARRGFEGTRMEDLAEASGIPKATFYYYFTSKEEILVWLLRATMGAVEGAVRQAAVSPGQARERLAQGVRAVLDVMAEHPAAFVVLFLNLGRAGRAPDLVAAVETAFHAPMVGLLREGVDDGSLRAFSDPHNVAWMLWGSVTIPALQILLLDERLEPDKLCDPILTILLSGLAIPD